MYVSHLQIANFRGIKTASIPLGPNTVVIGPNSVGKTAIVEALTLLLGRDRLIRDLTEHDFYGSDPQPTDRIRLVATITDFPGNSLERNSAWFNSSAGVDKWLDLKTSKLAATKSSESDLLSMQIAVDCRFDRATLDVETVRYFFDDEDTRDALDDESVNRVPPALLRHLGFFLDPVNRTWDRTISFTSDLFRQVVQYAGDKPSEAVVRERDRLRLPDEPMELDANIAALIQSINQELSHYFTRPVDLKLRLTTTDSTGVLSSVVPHYQTEGGTTVPARREGTGLVSLQKLALLMQFGHLRKQRGDNFVMAIEEPELHIPPPLQRRLLNSMRAFATQTIVTTHSPTIASACSPTDLLLVRNDKGSLSGTPLLREPLSASTPNPIRQILLSDRTNLIDALMHEQLLVPEGKSEFLWLTRLARIVEISSSTHPAGVDFAVKIGVVPTNSNITPTVDFLLPRHPRIACLVDGDSQGDAYLQELMALTPSVPIVLTWPTGWTIENAIQWIIAADPTVLKDPLLKEAGVPDNLDALSEQFTVATGPGRLKQNYLAHDALADAMASSSACITRAHFLLSEIVQLLTRPAHQPTHFARDEGRTTSATSVWTFQPING